MLPCFRQLSTISFLMCLFICLKSQRQINPSLAGALPRPMGAWIAGWRRGVGRGRGRLRMRNAKNTFNAFLFFKYCRLIAVDFCQKSDFNQTIPPPPHTSLSVWESTCSRRLGKGGWGEGRAGTLDTVWFCVSIWVTTCWWAASVNGSFATHLFLAWATGAQSVCLVRRGEVGSRGGWGSSLWDTCLMP